MADFRIAGGYVEVSTRLDKDQIRGAAREASAAMDAEMATAGDKGGKTYFDWFGKSAASSVASEGDKIAKTLEEKLGNAGDEAGAQLGKKLSDGVGSGKFETDVKAKIASALKNLPEVKVDANTTDADLKVAALRAELSSLKDERVGVTIDEGLFIAQLARIKAELEALGHESGSVKLRFDTSAAAKDLGAFTSLVGSRLKTDAEKIGRDAGDSTGRGFLSKIGSTISGGFESIGGAILSGFQKVPGAIGSMFGSIGSAIAGFAGSVAKWGLIVGEGLQVAPPIIAVIAAGLASLPALAIGAAGAIAMLGLGFHGIGAAIGQVFNPPASGGGGGGANQADQVAAAERRLTLAQRSAADAQINLNEAREQAVNDLVDMNLQLARAHLDESGAILAVKQAEIDLANARNTAADPLAVSRAQQALLEANQSLKEAKQHTLELQEQTTEANAAGVEGSAKVKAALEAQQSAVYGVKDAQDALKQSSVSAGASAVSAISKLSPNARAFVEEIAKLKPQLVDLQMYVQDKLFAGLGEKLDTWAHVWIPQLKTDLGGLATSTNGFAKRLGDDLSKPEMRAAVDGVFKSMERVLDKFTTGGSLDKLVKGFSDLVSAATPFVEKIGTGLVNELGKLGTWLSDKKTSGAMSKFFSDAAKDAQTLWDIGKDVFSIVGQIIDIALGKTQSGAKGNALDSFKETLDGVDKWLKDPKNKQTVKDVIDGFHKLGGYIVDVIGFVALMVAAFDRWRDVIKINFAIIKSYTVDVLVKGFLDAELAILGVLKNIVDGADHAFAWVPGLGPKLDTAKKWVDDFVGKVNGSLDKLQTEHDITIVAAIAYDSAKHSGPAPNQNAGHRFGAFDAFAAGGLGSLTPGIYSSANGLIKFAEPETGGELYMPVNSPDSARQQALAGVAAGIAGGTFTPNQGRTTTVGGASGGTQMIHVHLNVDGKEIGKGLVVDPRKISAATSQGNRQRSFTDTRVRSN